VRQLAEELEAWDHRFERDRPEPLVFTAAMWFAVKRVFGPLLPEALYEAIAQRSPPFFLGQLRSALADRFEGAAALLPGGKDAVLLGALQDAADCLATSGAKQYGDLHVAIFGNEYGAELARPPSRSTAPTTPSSARRPPSPRCIACACRCTAWWRASDRTESRRRR
jgi:hypothetical protein